MELFRACVFRYFASSLRPRRSLVLRAGGFLLGCAILSMLAYRLTPPVLALQMPPDATGRAVTAVMISSLATSLLFLLSHVPYQSYLLRTEILRYLPLSRLQMYWLRGFGFVPVLLAGVALSAGVNYRLLPEMPPLWVGLCVVCGSLCAALANSLLRAVGYALVAQVYAFASAGVGFLAIRCAILEQNAWLSVLGAAVLATHGVLLLTTLLLPPRYVSGTRKHGVIAFQRLSLANLMLAVAWRSLRFRRALLFWAALSGALILLAGLYPADVPFDAVAVASLLLAGSLGQEIRALSDKRYPLAIVLYGRTGKWLAGSWVAGIVMSLLTSGTIVLAGMLGFGGQLSVDSVYAVCFGMSLMVAGMATATLTVPQRHDIIGQFGAATLYIVAAWGIVKMFAWLGAIANPWLALFTAGFVTTGYLLSWAVELVRWRLTTQGGGINVLQR